MSDETGKSRLVDGTDFWRFMYAGSAFDPQDPLKGFLRSELLVKVCVAYSMILPHYNVYVTSRISVFS